MKVTIHATPENTKTILDLAEEQGISLPCNCHGANACGGKQYDFSCAMVPQRDVTVTIPDSREFEGLTLEMTPDSHAVPDSLLIDLGTTTVAMVWYDSAQNLVFHSEVFPNPQISYGADIISRIKYDVEFHSDYTLKTRICNEIKNRFEAIASSRRTPPLKRCLIGANTTMLHLLMGYPLDGMTGSPFTPFVPEPSGFCYNGTDIILIPWLSPFIGGDITAGLLSLGFDLRRDTCLLADLGTNGELALLHGDVLYTASTAAGPVFEGGSLSCGCPAVPGAISDVTLTGVMPKLQTIGNKLPSGICGSGAISILSQLITRGYLLPSGILSKNFPPDGLVISRTHSGGQLRVTPTDIRQIQLAAAAIGAGIDALCMRAGISPKKIPHLYLAGGLGYHINIEKAAVTGLFSDIPIPAIRSVGNSCLQGLALISSDTAFSRRTERLKSMNHELILADDDYFKERFLDHLA